MFDAASFIEESAQKMKDEIDQIAIIACSGGVDSTVAAVIANQAIGSRGSPSLVPSRYQKLFNGKGK